MNAHSRPNDPVARARRVGLLAGAALLLGTVPLTAASKPSGPVAARAGAIAPTVTAVDAGLEFLPPLGGGSAGSGAQADWLLPFAAVEVCFLEGSSCGVPVARMTSRSRGAARLRLGSHFQTVWHGSSQAGRYRVRVLVGPMELGHTDVLVSTESRVRGGDARVIRPSSSLPVKFRIAEEPFWASLPELGASVASAPPGLPLELSSPAAPFSGAQLELFVAGERAPVRATSDGGLLAAMPLFIDEDTLWPAPPAGPADVLLFSDGVAVASGRGAITVSPLLEAPGSAEDAQRALDGIAASLRRIGETLVAGDQPGEQEQWLRGLSAGLDELVNGADPRSLAGALAASTPAERRLLDAWFAASGMVAALRQYEALVADAAAAFEAGDTIAGVASLRMLARADASFRTLATSVAASTSVPASASFPSDLELSGQMQFYEKAKVFGETFVAQTNTQFTNYVGIAAGAIGLVRSVPAVAVISAILAVADFAINKLFVALLPANLDRFELTLASVLLDPGETSDAVLQIAAVNDPPPIGIQDVIGTALGVIGLGNTPEIQGLKDALLQTAAYMLGLVQAGIATYASENPDAQLNTSVGSIPALRWEATVTDPSLVDRRSTNRTIVRGLPDGVNWRAESCPAARGQAGVFATTAANAFGDDMLSSNTVLVRVECVAVVVSPQSVTLGTGASQLFTATVSQAQNTAVTWSATGGAIDPAGFYIAGTAPGLYTVTATSVEDPTRSASATVTIASPAVTIAINPPSAVLNAGDTMTFSATVNGATSTAVTWSATGGTISSNGLYTAGAAVGIFTVTAGTLTAPPVVKSAQVTITTVDVQGRYVGTACTISSVSGEECLPGFTVDYFCDFFANHAGPGRVCGWANRQSFQVPNAAPACQVDTDGTRAGGGFVGKITFCPFGFTETHALTEIQGTIGAGSLVLMVFGPENQVDGVVRLIERYELTRIAIQ